MRASSITASLMTALCLAGLLYPFPRTASAADLYGDGYSGAPPPGDYEDFADEGAPPPEYDDGAPPPERYAEPYDRVPEGHAGSIKDGYPVPVPPPRYSEARPERYACLDRVEIRRRLRHDGWRDMRPLDRDGPLVDIRARRVESGRAFLLRVDRCSGDVVAARPHYLRAFAPYARPAWRQGYWRDDAWPRRRWARHRHY